MERAPRDFTARLNWRQACDFIGCGRAHFYRLLQAGEFPGAYRIGKRRGIRVPRKYVEAFLERNGAMGLNLDRVLKSVQTLPQGEQGEAARSAENSQRRRLARSLRQSARHFSHKPNRLEGHHFKSSSKGYSLQDAQKH